ncbi:MAG: VanW family protein [Clostridia bacterium]|nr:VanW family protein [Clostridia bacterium]
MKRFLALLLLAALLPLHWASCFAENQPDASARLYYARTRLSCKVFSDWETTNGINQIGYIPENVRVVVHALNPSFALVTYEADHKTGYVKRVCLENPTTIDPSTTPPYGVDFNHYLVTIQAQDAPVWSAPGGGEALITLHAGARVSLIGFEEGYGKVIYHRQYGYIDSRLMGDVASVYDVAETAGTDAPIASYTSFYKITTDESNLNRINNIVVACDKMNVFPFSSGTELNFNRDMGPYSAANGYLPAGVLADGGLNLGYGGGTCQVSSTLYNVVLQLPGLTVLQRRAHGDNGASYLPIGVDAAVGNSALNFRFRNDYPFPIRIDASAQDGALTIAIYKAI